MHNSKSLKKANQLEKLKYFSIKNMTQLFKLYYEAFDDISFMSVNKVVPAHFSKETTQICNLS